MDVPRREHDACEEDHEEAGREEDDDEEEGREEGQEVAITRFVRAAPRPPPGGRCFFGTLESSRNVARRQRDRGGRPGARAPRRLPRRRGAGPRRAGAHARALRARRPRAPPPLRRAGRHAPPRRRAHARRSPTRRFPSRPCCAASSRARGSRRSSRCPAIASVAPLERVARRAARSSAELTGRHGNLFLVGGDGIIRASAGRNLSQRRKLVAGRALRRPDARARRGRAGPRRSSRASPRMPAAPFPLSAAIEARYAALEAGAARSPRAAAGCASRSAPRRSRVARAREARRGGGARARGRGGPARRRPPQGEPPRRSGAAPGR